MKKIEFIALITVYEMDKIENATKVAKYLIYTGKSILKEVVKQELGKSKGFSRRWIAKLMN